ncbi:MAG: CehA/McbA family metallohydrolase [bacterium]|nr:CehA/McbA family metallohydrolase [bacterium]
MNIPPSAHFTPISLDKCFNVDRTTLEGFFNDRDKSELSYGNQSLLGIPFALGKKEASNAILLDKESVAIELDEIKATYIIFLHVVEDRKTNYLDDLADYAFDGNELGNHVSDYALKYADGEIATTPVLRRFAIQQLHIGWGASAFAAQPATRPHITMAATEEQSLDRRPQAVYGRGETRHGSGRDGARERLWVYALPNPHPDKPIRKITLTPKTERSLVFGITHTQLTDHPLRPGIRQKLKLHLPEGSELNRLGEIEGVDIDLGQVITARAVLDYDTDRWLGTEPNVQPERSENEVVVEYLAHPRAKLYVATGSKDDPQYVVYDLSRIKEKKGVVEIKPAHRPVRVKVTEKGSGKPVAVRFHMHGEAGEYLPPKGMHRRINNNWFEDNYGEFANGENQYCYIPGECVADLPLGDVYLEIRKGYEIQPIREKITITPDTDELTFEIDHVLDWRSQGWVTADTHVHFLTPTTAHLEGQGEGVNVVNLLASQWGEMFSNVSDFDGKTTLGARDFGGDGEFLVRVGTENRMQVLGHISLLGYSGSMIHPLCTGGPSESALGDPQEVTMAEWAQRCIDQNGLVVMPHGPNPQCERAADIVLGLIHAMEMMTFNPHFVQLNPYGIADWYRYLNLGYHIPVVGGSDKMSASSQLGGVRTYAHMGDREFTYENWMTAVKSGNTFVTVGPLAELTVEGKVPGEKLELPASGGSVNVTWKVDSVSMPIEQVEIIVGSLTDEQVNVDNALSASGSKDIQITDSTWIGLRVRGSYRDKSGDIAAHTSAVQVLLEDKPLFNQPDATAVLDQIEGAIAYLDTIAPRPDATRFRQMRATLEAAHNRLHQRMHKNGIFHEHTPLHDHGHSHEH